MISLATCDLAKTCVFYTIYFSQVLCRQWILGSIGCLSLMKSVLILFSISSISTLVLTFERYLIIAKPHSRIFTKRRSKVILITLWLILPLLLAPPFLFRFSIRSHEDRSFCISNAAFYKNLEAQFVFAFEVLYLFIVIFIPCFAIIFFSTKTARILAKISETGAGSQINKCPKYNKKMTRNQNAIKTLRSIALGYIASYIPWAIMYIMTAIEPIEFANWIYSSEAVALIWLICACFANTPLTYALYSDEFRKASRRFFKDSTQGSQAAKVAPVK